MAREPLPDDPPGWLVAWYRLLGQSPVQAQWKARRWQSRWRRVRSDLEPPSRRSTRARRVCPHCEALNPGQAARCTGCGKTLASPMTRVMRGVGLSIPPFVSASALIGLACVALYARIVLGIALGRDIWNLPSDALVAFGGRFPPAVQSGEWWRLGTAVFLHASVLHLLFNLLALAQIGPAVEELFGRGRMVFLYMLTGIVANAGSLLFGSIGVGIGASGAIMGLVGVAAGWGQREGTARGRTVRNHMLKWAVYTMVFGAMIKADNVAHAVGFIAGGALGLALKPERLAVPARRTTSVLLGLVGSAAALASVLLVATRTPPTRDAFAAYLPDGGALGAGPFDDDDYEREEEPHFGGTTANPPSFVWVDEVVARRKLTGQARVARPLSEQERARLHFPGERPIPLSLDRWLAYDRSPIAFEGDALRFEKLDVLAGRIFGPHAAASLRDLARKQLPGDCLAIEVGDESRRFLYVGEPYLEGDEYPVFWISVDDVPAVGLYAPNFGVAMALDEGLVTSAPGRVRTYSDLFGDARFAPEMQELARRYTRGQKELEGGADTGPPAAAPLPSR